MVDTLAIKCKRALKQTGFKRLVIAGGVSANKYLRLELEKLMVGMKGEVFYPRTEFCTDNGGDDCVCGDAASEKPRNDGLECQGSSTLAYRSAKTDQRISLYISCNNKAGRRVTL